jgi:Invasin, domain 3
VQLAGPQGPLAGEQVAISSSDTAQKIGPVTDHGDGTYTATVTSSRKVESATITASDSAYGAVASASTTLTQALARKVKLSLKPTSLIAGAPATSTATVSVTAGSVAVSGEHVVLSSSDPGVAIGPVLDNGNGTYTATIAPSHTVGTVNITATDTTVSPYATASATLKQAPPTIKATLKPKTIPANGVASTTVTVKVTAKTLPLPGQEIVVTSSDPGELIGPVTDHGDGTYTATVTASLTPGTVTITASDLSVSPAANGSVTLTQS